MERALTPDEKIRRAEEIYYRKRIQASTRDSARVNVGEEKNWRLFKKIFLQLLICAVIYLIFYLIQTTNYSFSGNVINKTKEILSYDIQFQNIYNQILIYVDKLKTKEKKEKEQQVITQIQEEKVIEENVIDTGQTENIGGEQPTEDVSNLSQMELDAKNILENYSLIIPLKGEITSRFGLRNPTTITVPKEHTGIDIAVNEGTVFISAMSGIVELVSNKGDYRKSYKNNKWRCYDNICTLQNYICKARRFNYSRTTNRRGWSNRKCNRSTFTF